MDNNIMLNSQELTALSSCAWMELVDIKCLQLSDNDEQMQKDEAERFDILFSAYKKLEQFPSEKGEEMALHHIEQCAKERLERERKYKS